MTFVGTHQELELDIIDITSGPMQEDGIHQSEVACHPSNDYFTFKVGMQKSVNHSIEFPIFFLGQSLLT